MEKNICELTIEEFVRLLCGVPKIYELDLTAISKKIRFEQHTIKGDYWTLHDFFNQQLLEDEPIRSFAHGVLKVLSKLFDYSLEYSVTDIYDYLDYKTKGFEVERCKTVLFDMDYFLFIIKEEIEEDGEEYEGQFTDYYSAISILKNKIGSMVRNTGTNIEENKTNGKSKSDVVLDKIQADNPGKNKKSNNNFKSLMINDEGEEKLNRLKYLIKGKVGKHVVLIIKAAMKKGWLLKPTFRQVKDEFGYIGAEQGFNKYFNIEYPKDEMEAAIKALE